MSLNLKTEITKWNDEFKQEISPIDYTYYSTTSPREQVNWNKLFVPDKKLIINQQIGKAYVWHGKT